MIDIANYSNNPEKIFSITKKRKPNFQNLADVLERKIPKRKTLFEFFLNNTLYSLANPNKTANNHLEFCIMMVNSFYKYGYDYATVQSPNAVSFIKKDIGRLETISLNHEPIIYDKKSFDSYKWPDIESVNYDFLKELKSYTPPGLKLIPFQPGGVLENVIDLVGYDNLCYMLIENEALASDIFECVGKTLYNHTKKCLEYDNVGAVIVNDDWGFNTQTMISPKQLRKYVIPWHKEITSLIHSKGRYSILHSCGNLTEVYDDIIDDISFDGKHSYEDNIEKVEDAYDRLHKRISILGGIDLDFIYQNSIEEVYKRSLLMSQKGQIDGGYALGTGNSVPEYIKQEKYFSMILAAFT